MGKTLQGSLPWLTNADGPNPLFHKQDVFIFVGTLTDPTAWSTISFSSSAVSLSKFSRSRSSLRRSSSSRTLCFSITLLVGSSAALPDWRQRRQVQRMHFVADRFYVAPFSTLQQTQCALVACDSEWVTSFYSAFFNTFRSDVLTVLFGCYMAGAMWNCCHLATFCVHYTTMHHVMSLHAKSHTLGACVFSCNLPPALLAEWPGSSTVVEWILK